MSTEKASVKLQAVVLESVVSAMDRGLSVWQCEEILRIIDRRIPVVVNTEAVCTK
jgi:hypothetical protein